MTVLSVQERLDVRANDKLTSDVRKAIEHMERFKYHPQTGNAVRVPVHPDDKGTCSVFDLLDAMSTSIVNALNAHYRDCETKAFLASVESFQEQLDELKDGLE